MRFHITLALVALLLVGSAAAANAQEDGAGRLQFVHAADDAPPVVLELAGPMGGGGLLGWWTAEPGTTVDVVPDTPLAQGWYELTIWPPGAEGTGGQSMGTIQDLLIEPGFTSVVTFYADDEQGRPVYQVVDPRGTHVVRPVYPGTVAIEHDVDDLGTIEAVFLPLGYDSEAFSLGPVEPGDLLEAPIDSGTHTLVLRDDGELLGTTEFTIKQDQVTLIRVSDVIDTDDPQRPTEDPRPHPRPTEIPTPNRVDTGGGGAAHGDTGRLLGVIAALVLVAGAVLAARPNRAGR